MGCTKQGTPNLCLWPVLNPLHPTHPARCCKEPEQLRKRLSGMMKLLTVPSVQELGEVHGAARGPRLGLVQVDEKRSHHMVLAEGPEEPLTGLGVIVGHAEHVA